MRRTTIELNRHSEFNFMGENKNENGQNKYKEWIRRERERDGVKNGHPNPTSDTQNTHIYTSEIDFTVIVSHEMAKLKETKN